MSPEPLALPDKVVAIDRALAGARIRHAFGGALALAYYAEPRGTIDIDVNVFAGTDRLERVSGALRDLGVDTAAEARRIAKEGQVRWWWDRTPVDVFFAYDPLHDAMRERTRRVPFGEDRIPILAPEDLVICKAVFDRAKDWLDIEQILVAGPDLDRAEIGSWLDRLVGAGDARRARFEELASR